MSEYDVIFFSFIGLLAGIFFFFHSFTDFRKKRLIENTPTSKIRSLAMGQVEVYGKVAAYKDNLIKSPFSASKCVYCLWTLEEYKKSGKNSRWVEIKKGIVGRYFLIKDDTGAVLADITGAEIDIPKDYEYSTGLGKGPTPIIEEFLKKNNMPSKTFFVFNRQLRFREFYLSVGDKVFCMGAAGDNPFVEEGSSQANEADIMIQKGAGDSFYYISDKPEKQILNSLRWKVLGQMILGGGLIVICLFIIFGFFGIL